MGRPKAIRAIDLYSGVGGWSAGLRMAGISVVASYERSEHANITNARNNGHATHTVDLRALDLNTLPKDIDVVVGSPPCTQFSMSNRGGNGDISDGLKDIKVFLEVVDRLKPRFWAMENVPRVAEIIQRELKPRGLLKSFQHLAMNMKTLNLEDFGLPQRRKRCIVGNFNFEHLRGYTNNISKLTLGDVISALASERIIDPIYGCTIPADELTEHHLEYPLSEEEVRINRASKLLHPVYNSMPFPDLKDRSARTVTATCTRVGRESIVVEDCNGEFRRLTLRERACLQGFPITFQFFGQRYAKKIEMIGNALPPLLSFYIGAAIRGLERPSLVEAYSKFVVCTERPLLTMPERPQRRYRLDRKFRFAIPALRLKSGVRFELANEVNASTITWKVDFFFGTSKSIHQIRLNDALLQRILKKLPTDIRGRVETRLSELKHFLQDADALQLQRVWTHTGPGSIRPFDVLDTLNAVASDVTTTLDLHPNLARSIVASSIKSAGEDAKGRDKLFRNSGLVLAGLIVGSAANALIHSAKITHAEQKVARANTG